MMPAMEKLGKSFLKTAEATSKATDSVNKLSAAMPKTKWYELDWLLPYKDVVLVVGFALLTAAAAHRWGLDAALAVAGVEVLWLAWLMMGK